MTRMKRFSALIALILIALYSVSALTDKGLFPTGNQLFGVAMPDIRFAVEKEPDSTEITEEGETVSYRSFTVADYEAFGRYAKAEGLKLERQDYQDNMLTTDLSKEDSIITFQYCYKNMEASLFYPKDVRKESEKSEAQLSDSILPDASSVFGSVIPSLDIVLKDHSATRMSRNGHDTICYNDIMISDYDQINAFLTAIGCNMTESKTEDNVFYAELILRNGSFTIQYDILNKRFIIVCPELFFIDCDVQMTDSTLKGQLVLPSADQAFGTVLPRISSAIQRYPEKTEILQDGSMYEEYSEFSEEDYALFSKYLSDKGCTVGDYHVDDTGKLIIPLSRNVSEFVFTYDKINKRGTVVYYPGTLVEPLFTKSNDINDELETDTYKANGEKGNQAFIPTKIVEEYNDSIIPLFKALIGDSYDFSDFKDAAEVSFFQTELGTSSYANRDQTIFINFGSTEQNKPAPNMSFYASLKNDNDIKNLPEFAFAYAVSNLDELCIFEEFGAWINDANDGDTYKTKSFSALYNYVDGDHINLLLVNEDYE